MAPTGGGRFFGENITELRPRAGARLARETVGEGARVFQSELPGGEQAARQFFEQQVGLAPAARVEVGVAGGRRFTFRPSGRGGAGPPTVEVVDTARRVVEKIRFLE